MMEFTNDQIDINTIPKAENLIFQPLDGNFQKIRMINWAISLVVVIALLIAQHMFRIVKIAHEEYMWIVYVLVALFFIFRFIVILKEFPFLGYALRQKDIIYRKGWLNKKWTHIPYNRIQHAEVTQGLVYRLFNLGKLKVFTAGGSASDLSIGGIPMNEAIDMKGLILKKTTYVSTEEE